MGEEAIIDATPLEVMGAKEQRTEVTSKGGILKLGKIGMKAQMNEINFVYKKARGKQMLGREISV